MEVVRRDTVGMRRFLTRENLFALALCILLLLLVIATSDSGPLWIYQGF